MERVKLDNKRILFNLLPAHVAQHFLMSNPRNMVSLRPGRHLLSVTSPAGFRGGGWRGCRAPAGGLTQRAPPVTSASGREGWPFPSPRRHGGQGAPSAQP